MNESFFLSIQVFLSRMLFCFLLHQILSFALSRSLPYMPLVIPPSNSPALHLNLDHPTLGSLVVVVMVWYGMICTCTFHLSSVQCSASCKNRPAAATTTTTLSSASVHPVIHPVIHSFIPSELVPSAKVADTAELALRSMQSMYCRVWCLVGLASYIR